MHARIGSGSSILGECRSGSRDFFYVGRFLALLDPADQNQSLPLPTYVTDPACFIDHVYGYGSVTCCSPAGSFLLDVRLYISYVRWQEFVCDCRVGDQRQAEQASGCLLWRHGKL
jgi:hypothetical protein